MNGKFIRSGRIETYPFRIPMPLAARVAVLAGVKVAAAVLRYANVVRQRPGESGAVRQQRIYDFENERTFADFVGDLPDDAAALFKTTVSRSAGEMDEISAGAGIGYFSLVWNVGQGLNRGIVGGPSTLTEAIAAAWVTGCSSAPRWRRSCTRPTRSWCATARTRSIMRSRPAAWCWRPQPRSRIGSPSTCPRTSGRRSARSVYGPHVLGVPHRRDSAPWDDSYAIAARSARSRSH